MDEELEWFDLKELDKTMSPESVNARREEHLKKHNIEVDEQGITLYWSANKSEYFIEWGRLKTKDQLVDWLMHINPKIWPYKTAESLRYFIEEVAYHNDWANYEL